MKGMREEAKKFYLEYLDGSGEAFASLVGLLTPRFFRMFCHLGAQACDAEDLCQELFAALHRAGDSYSRERDFMPWAYAIARNIYYREASRAARVRVVRLGPWLAAKGAPETGAETVAGLLSKLTDEKRLVFELKHFQGLKFGEIAEALGVPVGTVKSRMFAALSELRAMIERSGS